MQGREREPSVYRAVGGLRERVSLQPIRGRLLDQSGAGPAPGSAERTAGRENLYGCTGPEQKLMTRGPPPSERSTPPSPRPHPPVTQGGTDWNAK
ncbi:hypothetical protein PBY51_022085 [Eleginops maclovinus]|uniref:Uncharacterized protein n=1 Tax=Eleginops maclovinus TaxID=56733 RepID=A0AAN8AI06_ELEMC|nr:hypothetical protein PBY51_022085 [Eleginops maclovinus]